MRRKSTKHLEMIDPVPMISGNIAKFINEKIEKLDFILKKDFIKDQYGESPIKNEYIKAPFESLLKNIEKREKIIALFIIDGGPRFDILKRILDLGEKNKNFSPVIFLCDANRIFYNEQIKRRSNGNYIEGTNKTLNRGTIYENQTYNPADKVKLFYGKENISAHELIEKEVWYYNSVE